jgi:small neutral amino acid transporter SnatA (MarC family)
MNGDILILALVSALVLFAGVSAFNGVSADVLEIAAGFALGTGAVSKHEGEPAPASPPPPLPEQAPAASLSTASSSERPSPGYPPGLPALR